MKKEQKEKGSLGDNGSIASSNFFNKLKQQKGTPNASLVDNDEEIVY